FLEERVRRHGRYWQFRTERADLSGRRSARHPLQRRRRAGALQLHPAGGAPRGLDRRRRLDGRRLACTGEAAAFDDRGDRASRARGARRRAARDAARGEGALRELRGAPRLLRRNRAGAALVTVWLVGAGPGDPGLITAKGLELVRSCEALVYDMLVAPELVAEAPDDALLIPRAKLKPAELEELL